MSYDGFTDTRGWVDDNEFAQLNNKYHDLMDAADAAENQVIYQLMDGVYDSGFEAGVEAQKHGLGEAA